MTYRLIKTWPDPHMQRLATWTCEMMNAAGPTAAQIGCSKEAIIAQAALESAWGASAIGHNIFGIKADASWKGPTKTVATREVINGQDVMIDAAFRDYPSYAESIADHFAFLKANSRYAAAGVFNAVSDEAYFEALQRAGYATDPNYARSLMNMLASVKMFTTYMVDEQTTVASTTVTPEPPPIPPPGYTKTDSGNIIRDDPKQSTIVKKTGWAQLLSYFGAGMATIGGVLQQFKDALGSMFGGIHITDTVAICLTVLAVVVIVTAALVARSAGKDRIRMWLSGIA